MSKLLIRSESFLSMVTDMTTLIDLHHKEIEDQRLKCIIDYNAYMSLEYQGMFHGFTVRDVELGNKLVGYATFVTTPPLHSLGTKVALSDTLYVLPSYRGRWVGVKLLKYVERVLKDIGVTCMTLNTKAEHDFGGMLKRIGYEPSEVQYMKHLGE